MHTRTRLLLVLTSAISACSSSPVAIDASADATSTPDAGAATDASDAATLGDAEASTVDARDDDALPTIRRPFLVGSSMRSAAPQARDDWSSSFPDAEAIDAATRALLAATWLKDALEEHASVAAFARFTMHLLSVGAPADLVVRAQRASLDEVMHAKMCFGIAARYGGALQGPGALALDDAFSESGLEAIARLTAEEGCVGETLGALLAREQAAVARDPAVVGTLERIARDEERHAELAWRFVAWAVGIGGPSIARAVEERVTHACAETLAAELKNYDGVDLAAWHAHGRLTCHEARAVASRGIEEVVMPALAQVVRRPLGRNPFTLDVGAAANLRTSG